MKAEAMAEDLQGQVIVVTGGAGGDAGLGLTATEALLRAGARVAVWDVDLAAIASAREELEGEGLKPYFQKVDVTDRAQVQTAHAELEREVGPVDTLVNNAALKSRFVGGTDGGMAPFWELDLDRYHKLWEVNVFGALIVTAQ